MQPDFDLRIRSMTKALAEIVLPAIDAANSAALEQAHIVLGSLEMLRQQVDFAHPFLIADLTSTVSLCRAVAEKVGEAEVLNTEATIIDALSRAHATNARLSDLHQASIDLRRVLSALIEKAYAGLDDDRIAAIQALVVRDSREPIARERAYVSAANFDVFPDSLRPLGTLI